MVVGDARRAVVTLAAVLVACLAGITSAARTQVTVAVSAPASVPAHAPVLVRVEVAAPAGAVVRLTPPSFVPFALAETGHTPRDTAGLQGRQRIEWRFVLRPSGAGTFAFAPFEADVAGPGLRPATFRSRAWTIAVLPAPAPTAVVRSELGTADPERLDFDAQIAPSRVYVGQQATLDLRVGVGARVRERLRRSPEFAFPTVAGVVSYDLRASHASTVAGDVHVYRRALFPLAPGTIDVPPAQLVYALTPADDPFGTEERSSARTPVRHIVVVAPPTAGRPPTWDGAVGRYTAAARIDSAHARVGDAVVYTLRVEGTGNLMLLPRPPLAVDWADVAPGAERVVVDTSGPAAGGAKEFDWLLTPRAAGDGVVPPVHYAYFDPERGYAFADAPAVGVRVAPTPRATGVAALAPAAASPRVLTRTGPAFDVVRELGPDRGPSLAERREFWLALAAVPVPAALWLAAAGSYTLSRRRRARAPSPDAPADAPRARAARALGEFTDGVLPLLGGPLAPAHGPPAALEPATLARALRRAGVTPSLAAVCAAAADAWARAAYGDGAPGIAEPLEPSPRDLLARVAAELGARRAAREPDGVAGAPSDARSLRAPGAARRRFGHGVAFACGAAALAAVGLGAPRGAEFAAADRARAVAPFDAGIAAYGAGDFPRARDLFAVAAGVAPRAPAAWLNAGTAAWASGDTADAAFAWQRAGRLAPGLAGLDARVEQLPAAAPTALPGLLARVDASVLAAAALALGAAATLWTLAAAAGSTRAPHGARRRLASGRGALASYAASVLVAGAAAYAARAADPRGHAVVRASGLLRPEPGATPDAGSGAVVPSAATGEVGRVVDVEGGWTRVRLDGGREGWLPSAQLAPLDGTL